MRVFLLFSVLGLLVGHLPSIEAADFVKDVQPILNKHCVSCHGPEKQRASLRLDSARGIHTGGNSGPAVVAGKADQSLLVQALTGSNDVKPMPPKGPRLSADEITLVRNWIDQGAKIPPGERMVVSRPKSSHWSFQPVVRPPVPDVKQRDWPRHSLDHFILARLEKEGIRPSPEADRITLLRRLHLDLIGLAPTPEEIDAFLRDGSPEAYERVVERLLASPHYGERWGRHWLDLARYADSNGYSIDSARTIWKYRDWVIEALNADQPFDQFTVDQLAGDLRSSSTLQQKIATGFHRNTQINEEGGIDLEQFRVEAIVDRVNTTGAVWLGLTLGCAQCHDHKYDPLSQKEYYQVYAFFNNSDDPKLDLITPEVRQRRVRLQGELNRLQQSLYALDRLNGDSLERWVGSLDPEARKLLPRRIQTLVALPPNGRNARQMQELFAAYRDLDKLRHVTGSLAGPFATLANAHLVKKRVFLERRIDELKKALPVTVTTMVLNERKMPRTTAIQLGGDFLKLGAVVRPDVPGVLPPLPEKATPTRMDLAEWLVNGKNPLTGRVLVNRLWQHFFGLGLVETENDFGTQGTKPSHPELLDWLADELVRRGWSLKQMHRMIVTSATYRQSSKSRPDLRTLDPRNRLLARQNRIRLEAEIIRDVALGSSGLLTTTIGGPSVFPPQPPGVYSLTQVPKNWVASEGPDRFRRGVYTYFWRSAPHPGLTVFDAPDATATCTRRNRSNTPLQALTLLNDQAHLECAQALAANLLQQTGTDEERLVLGYRRTLSRTPGTQEIRILHQLLIQQRQALATDAQEARALIQRTALPGVTSSEQAAWIQVARVLLNLDEFITRE